MNATAEKIRNNLLRVRERVGQAAVDAGRTAEDVKIVGVTKYVDADVARMLFEAGCTDIGESRPQVLVEKATALQDVEIDWHLIGHLQRNKVARVLPFAQMIHSVDSVRLANAINRIAGEQDRTVDVLLEVNVSRESAKHGFGDANDGSIEDVLSEIHAMPNLNVRGLMAMAGLGIGGDETRSQFAALRQLRDQLQQQLPEDHRFQELSMGMSGDFELAIAEGATIVRIGSILFEGVL